MNTGDSHGACWVIQSDDDYSIMERFQQPMSGREVYGNLTSGRIDTGDVIYSIEISLAHDRKDKESYAYHEDDWIRRLLREKGILLKKLVPGTFLEPNERWDVAFSIQDNHITWHAISTVSGLYWKDRSFGFNLDPTLNLERAQDEFLSEISSEIPSDQTVDFEKLKSRIHGFLLSREYGEKGPPCHLHASRAGKEITIELNQIGGGLNILVSRSSFVVSKNDYAESVLSSFYNLLDDGELSNYTITNISEFFDTLEFLLSEIGLKD
jgi:hypothetical protein